MAKTGDAHHFDRYGPQTRVKHTIVEKYIPAFCHALRDHGEEYWYIDGFTGRGTYEAEDGPVEGSPLRAMGAIAEHDRLRSRVKFVFVEADDGLCQSLQAVVDQAWPRHGVVEGRPYMNRPEVHHRHFDDAMRDLLDRFGGQMPGPSFLFIDPCGVSGVNLLTAKRFMSGFACELFLFFNYEGVERILGLREKAGQTLVDLLGGVDRRDAIIRRWDEAGSAELREQAVVDYFRQVLQEEVAAEYIVTFRIEQKARQATSHYLIHVSKNPRGFAIMKDVMWGCGRGEDGSEGLEFLQRSNTGQAQLFHPDWDKMKDAITKELEGGQRQVAEFTKRWPERQEDRFCETAYRKALLELEGEGVVEMIDKDGQTPKPATNRQRRNGKPTLGPDYYVRLVPNGSRQRTLWG